MLVFLAALIFAVPADATFPGANGKIAFNSDRSGLSKLYTVNPDGSTPSQLGEDPSDPSFGDKSPAWSADGKKVGFSCGDGFSLCTMNADGSGGTDLFDWYLAIDDPTWSPDSARVAFTYEVKVCPDPFDECYLDLDVAAMNADGTAFADLARGSEPSWSPDGRKIAFAADQIATMNPDGSGVTEIHVCCQAPSWSPDQTKLAYARFTDGNYEIYVAGADGSSEVMLTTNTVDDVQPAWSPDGKQIAFASNDGGDYEIYVMNADGTRRHPITSNTAQDRSPDWQPIPYTGYPRPKGATPFKTYLVPAYKQCTNPNSNHGPPLSYPSCGARTESPNVTVGTPDANGAAAKSIDSILLRVRANNPATPGDEADVLINASTTDIRCTGTTDPAACGSDNSAVLKDYIGDLQARLVLRITDRNNTPNPGGPGPGTVSDTPFSFTLPCTGTSSDPSIGSTCVAATSADALVPGIVTGGQRSNWELGPVQVYDSGADGLASTTGDNTLFMAEGVFVP